MDDNLKNRSDISVVLLVFISLAVLGVLFGGFVVHDYARARASAAWPVANGIVLSQLDGDDDHVRYVYSVAGRSYEASRERFFTARLLAPAKGDYLPGETISVFVDPQDNSFAVLRPGGASVAFVLLFLLSGACVFFGGGGIVWTLSQSAREEFSFDAEPTYQ